MATFMMTIFGSVYICAYARTWAHLCARDQMKSPHPFQIRINSGFNYTLQYFSIFAERSL